MTIRGALIISAFLHSAILVPLSDTDLTKQPREKERPMVVDYVVIKEMSRKTPETSRVEVVKKVEIKAPVETPREVPKKAKAIKDVKAEAARREAEVRSTKDYINYHQLIREKIRRRLKDNYKGYGKEGEVKVLFTLNSDGSLETIDVDRAASTTDTALIDIALKSVRDASPLPSFPSAIKLPRLSFSLVISFRK